MRCYRFRFLWPMSKVLWPDGAGTCMLGDTSGLNQADHMQEDGVPLERLAWNKMIPGLSNLEGLYVEFIEVQAEVLQCMTHLAKLR